MIKNFKDIDNKDYNSLGGKALNLVKMVEAGFNVPDGFVISFNEDLQKLTKRIKSEFDRLEVKYVAVRSSATVEDSSDASFAGQFDTYLGVKKDELIEKITSCRNSVNNPRLKSYCEMKGINIKDVKVSVIVQKMIKSDISGVSFSKNPVNRNSSEIVIEAVFGLGEMIVSGSVTPDSYIVDKKRLDIKKKIITSQNVRLIISQEGKIQKEQLESDIGRKHKLSDYRIREVAKITKDLEVYFGYAVDVEWAYEKDKLYVLQSRPVTTC